MKDLTGQQFGRWTVLEKSPQRSKDGHIMWICKCSCEEQTIRAVMGKSLTSGSSQSCGCLRREKASIANQGNTHGQANAKDITNQTFNHLTALYRLSTQKKNSWEWMCQCDCGELTIATVVELKNNRKTRCEKCSQNALISKGEEKIISLLQQNNIKYEYQKSFESCRFLDSGKLAYFDFYIPSQNYLIEYDGEQHFSISLTSAWKDKYELIQKRDSFKNQWCYENNIPLIRIPYTHFAQLCFDDLYLNTSQFVTVANK